MSCLDRPAKAGSDTWLDSKLTTMIELLLYLIAGANKYANNKWGNVRMNVII